MEGPFQGHGLDSCPQPQVGRWPPAPFWSACARDVAAIGRRRRLGELPRHEIPHCLDPPRGKRHLRGVEPGGL